MLRLMPCVFSVQYNFTVVLKWVSAEVAAGEEKLFRYRAEVYMNIEIDREYWLLLWDKECLSAVLGSLSTLPIQSLIASMCQ